RTTKALSAAVDTSLPLLTICRDRRCGSGPSQGYPRCTAKPVAPRRGRGPGGPIIKMSPSPAKPMQSDPLLTLLRDERLANHALTATPVWLWAADGTRMLWANAAGAVALGAASPHALAERRTSAAHPLASEVVRLAGTLPHGGAARLERLRGIGALGRTLVCACARLAPAHGMPAILLAAQEAFGPPP